MLERSGGGLLTNGRMKKTESDLPSVPPMRPQMAQSAPQPQIPAQAATAPPAAPQAQQGIPQGMPQNQGMMPQGDEMDQGSSNNDLANNALALLHDEEAAPQYEQLIAEGEEGAARAAVMIGKQVVDAHLQRGFEPDTDQASDAIMEVVGDIAEIGMGMGAIPQEPLVNGVPAGVYAIMAYAADQWAAEFPEFGQSLKEEVSQATAEDDNAARTVAAYMKERKHAQSSQSAPQQRPAANSNPSGSVAGPPQPM